MPASPQAPPPTATVVLLDLDGTLVDSRPGIVTAMNATFRALGLAERSPEASHAGIGPPAHETFAAALGLAADDPALDDVVAAYRARYREGMLAGTRVYDGLPAALDALRDAGHPLAVATSKAGAIAAELLAGLGLAHRLQAVCGPGPTARDDKATTIAQALAALGHPARAVMVGDRHHDIDGAHAHGLTTVGVLWGLGTEAELRDAGADLLCAHPRELAACVARLAA